MGCFGAAHTRTFRLSSPCESPVPHVYMMLPNRHALISLTTSAVLPPKCRTAEIFTSPGEGNVLMGCFGAAHTRTLRLPSPCESPVPHVYMMLPNRHALISLTT